MKKVNFGCIVVLVLLLAACGSSPTPAPVAVADTPSPIVSASGKVLPARWATLSFQTGGQVIAVYVQAEDAVKAGEALVQLDEADAKIAIAEAEAALELAEAQLAQVKTGAQPEEITVAEQAVKSAEAVVAGAEAQLAQLQAGTRSAEIAAAEASVATAFVQRKKAQDNYDRVDEIGGWMEEEFRFTLDAAQKEYAAAQEHMEQLGAGPTRNELNIARARVSTAQAQQAAAQAQLDLLKAGVIPERVAVAEANVKQAQVAAEAARQQLTKSRLVAPFTGTVGTVFVREGEWASPGQSGVMLGDLTTLRVETTDLSELDVVRVHQGQAAKVTFDALSGVSLNGEVVRIAPMSTPGQTGVNYIMIIELKETRPELRWGMTAFVDIEVKD